MTTEKALAVLTLLDWISLPEGHHSRPAEQTMLDAGALLADAVEGVVYGGLSGARFRENYADFRQGGGAKHNQPYGTGSKFPVKTV